jgi:Disulphide bond corrector protein DsbC
MNGQRAIVARRPPRHAWVLAAPLCFGFGALVLAQSPQEVAKWSASLETPERVKPGGGAVIKLSAEIRDGWHVYALSEPAGGPTPLKVTLGDNVLARLSGSASGDAPTRKHDPSFDLDTNFYEHALTLRVPIALKNESGAGARIIPVDVRFQSCTDRICLPPTTVRLNVPVTVLRST